MTFKEIAPGPHLRPYIKEFYFYASDTSQPFDDIVFPSGNMELIFNLGEGRWQTKKEDHFFTTPPIEMWGQLTGPMSIRSLGRNIMLGIRFYTHSATCFFEEDASIFNNEVSDGADLFGPSIRDLHARLLDRPDLTNRIALLEAYLSNRLAVSEKQHHKIAFIGEIAKSLQKDGSNEKILSISHRHNISTRYLNQLFSQYTGIPPKLFCKISRFQYSLGLLHTSEQKLTGIAYDAGYFDQSHFIKEFKSFTGITPTSFAAQSLPINQLLAGN